MNPPRTFLSYANSDQSWADKLSSILAGAGISIWPGPASLPAGADFQAQIREVIHTATHILVLSAHRRALSRWVDREIELGTESREDVAWRWPCRRHPGFTRRF